jgi:hypothetical protein
MADPVGLAWATTASSKEMYSSAFGDGIGEPVCGGRLMVRGWLPEGELFNVEPDGE